MKLGRSMFGLLHFGGSGGILEFLYVWADPTEWPNVQSCSGLRPKDMSSVTRESSVTKVSTVTVL